LRIVLAAMRRLEASAYIDALHDRPPALPADVETTQTPNA
jgi:hypothetical protein